MTTSDEKPSQKGIYMKKSKRIFALAGAVLLIILYLSTLVFAFIDTDTSTRLLKASVALTILIPVLLYAFTMVYKLLDKNDPDDFRENDS